MSTRRSPKDPPGVDDASTNITSIAVMALLQEQYECTEAYCNASTALFGVLQSHPPVDHVLWTSMNRHQDAISRLQCNMNLLEQMVAMLEDCKTENIDEEEVSLFLRLWNGSKFLREHLQCTRRILGTLYGSCEGMSFDRLGLPKMNNCAPSSPGGVHVQLVALATLRASIEKVKESLPP